jgi:serine/threonine-protein kinase
MAQDKTGLEISHYRILSRLGAGGMGEVYKAEDIKLNRIVAIKFLAAKAIEHEASRKRFLREARSAALLSHKNIATVYEIVECDGESFIVMEYCQGQTLAALLKIRELAIGEVIDIAIQILSALQAAHEKKIIHRDIKAGNVLIMPSGRVKVLDFGIAKIKRESELIAGEPTVNNESFSAESLTGPDQILGTPNYLSPEQVIKDDVDERSDIFSFGVLLYQMIARRLPFESAVRIEVLAAILNQQPRPLVQYRKDLPPQLAAITERALAKNRQSRYQSARSARHELQALAGRLHLMELVSRKPIWPLSSSDPLDLVIAALTLIALVLSAMYAWKAWR